MTNFQIVIAGFGGQGILFTGKVIANAGLLDGKEVSWLPSYGPEMRGGTANCNVCISDLPIGSPLVTKPDVLIAMNGPSYDKFAPDVAPGGMIIIDQNLVQPKYTPEGVRVFAVPSTQLAIDQELIGLANMILLGKLLKETAFTSAQTLDESLKASIPPAKAQLLESNRRALALGMGQ